MPWKNQGGGSWQNGGGGRRGGPWGQGPQGGNGGGNNQSPDLEELLRRGQDRFKNAFPKGPGSSMGGFGPILPLIALIALGLLYLLSGFYQVQPDELGVVTRFGKYDRITSPGLRYHLPWPVEAVQKPRVTQQRSVDIGFTAFRNSRRDVPGESLMLTGDENIVDVDFSVLWLISNAPDYLFNVQNPESTVKAIAESAMREVVGRNNLEDILTQSRARVESEVRDLMQVTLDDYGAGVAISEVQLQKVDPPGDVIEAFRDVQAARQDLERLRNEAEAYANQVIPRARGDSERINQQAEAYKQRVIAEAQGGAARFLSIYQEYRQAPDVTRRRIFLETMERVLGDMNKVIIDSEAGGPGVVPYLPLPEIQKRARQNSSEGGNQ